MSTTSLGRCRVDVGTTSTQRCGHDLRLVNLGDRSVRFCEVHGDEKAALELQQAASPWIRERQRIASEGEA